MPTPLPHVVIDEFEGPFDLLIALAADRKIDLATLALTRLTEAYLRTLERQHVPASLLADFLVVAATLLLLKVKQLLPTLEPAEAVEIAVLSQRVRMYQLYREQAQGILARWDPQLLPAPERLTVTNALPWPELTPYDLAQTMHTLIANLTVPPTATRHLRLRGRTLQECVDWLIDRLQQKRQLVFQDALAGQSRDTLAVSFLAVLELARTRRVTIRQAQIFAPVEVSYTAASYE